MRKIAPVKCNPEVMRVMLFTEDDGCYVFFYNQNEDGPCFADQFEDSLKDAEQLCREDYGISSEEWEIIPNPLPECQHDWIAPFVRDTRKRQ